MLFGSKSKSVSNPVSQNAAFSEIGGNANSVNLNVGGSNSTVSVLDGGAINTAFEFAGQFGSDALRQVELAGVRSSAQLSSAIDAVSANARSDSSNFGQQAIKWGAIVAVVVALAWAATRAKG
jgi:hypothetical protein